jgi:hypothetical protein
MLKTVLQSYDALSASEADILNATQLVQLISEAKLLGLTLETLRVGYLSNKLFYKSVSLNHELCHN